MVISSSRLKKGLELFTSGGVAHKVGDLYAVSTKGGSYETYVNANRWSCNCTWGAVYSGSWVMGRGPCYHAIAAAAQADIDLPMSAFQLEGSATAPFDQTRDDDDPFEGLDIPS